MSIAKLDYVPLDTMDRLQNLFTPEDNEFLFEILWVARNKSVNQAISYYESKMMEIVHKCPDMDEMGKLYRLKNNYCDYFKFRCVLMEVHHNSHYVTPSRNDISLSPPLVMEKLSTELQEMDEMQSKLYNKDNALLFDVLRQARKCSLKEAVRYYENKKLPKVGLFAGLEEIDAIVKLERSDDYDYLTFRRWIIQLHYELCGKNGP